MFFLGFELDTIRGMVQLPAEKMKRTLALVREWSGKKASKRRELESLLGHLQHAATVMRPGRTFVRRLIKLLSVARSRDQWVRLNASTRSDLTWWEVFLEGWNGVSVMPRFSMPVVTVESDASGCWGVELGGDRNGFSGNGQRQPSDGKFLPRSCCQFCLKLQFGGVIGVGA